MLLALRVRVIAWARRGLLAALHRIDQRPLCRAVVVTLQEPGGKRRSAAHLNAADVRWETSPDGRAFLVIEDAWRQRSQYQASDVVAWRHLDQSPRIDTRPLVVAMVPGC